MTVLPLVEMGEKDAWSHFVVLVTPGSSLLRNEPVGEGIGEGAAGEDPFATGDSSPEGGCPIAA